MLFTKSYQRENYKYDKLCYKKGLPLRFYLRVEILLLSFFLFQIRLKGEKMSYISAEKVLPTELINQIHKYVSGECLYIPVMHKKRKVWGMKSGYRQELDIRDSDIFALHQKGISVSELSEKYFLSEKSIYRIISKMSSIM